MTQPIHRAACVLGTEVTVRGLVKTVYATNDFESLLPVEFTQVDSDIVLLHSPPAGIIYVKYFKKAVDVKRG